MTTRYHKHESCTVPGCTDPHAAKGYCNKHYLRHRKGANVNPDPHGRIRLRERRRALDMTQADVSARAHIGKSTYSHMEVGTENITPHMLDAINGAFESRRQELIAQHREVIRQLEALKPLTARDMEDVE